MSCPVEVPSSVNTDRPLPPAQATSGLWRSTFIADDAQAKRRPASIVAAIVAAIFLATLLTTATSDAAAILLSNGDFEVPEDIDPPLPSSFGDWAHDIAEIVTSENGIDPFSGSQMLKFIATSPTGASGNSTGSEVMQLVNVGGYPAGTPFRAAAYVNRVAGDAETDTEFRLELRAYAGDPIDFPSVINNPIDSTMVTLSSDRDETTWERLETNTFVLPAGADYLEFRFTAREDVFNDAMLPEFDGHYGDAAGVFVVPEPSAICVAVVSLLAVGHHSTSLTRSCRVEVFQRSPASSVACPVASRRARSRDSPALPGPAGVPSAPASAGAHSNA